MALFKWYPETCDMRTLAQKIFELSISHYDPNISLIIPLLVKDIKGNNKGF